MEILIRSYEEDDFESVKKILIDCFPEVADILMETLNTKESFKLDKNKYIQLVAVVENVVVGYSIVSRNFDPILKRYNFWIDYVCVNQEYRGRGIAKKLLLEIEKIAIDEDVLLLQLTSSRFRTSARKLYLDMGYEIRESDIFRKVLK